MTFPTPFTVSQESFAGTGADSLGNDVDAWATGVDVAVIGWYATQVENVEGHSSRVVSDVDLLAPPGLVVSVRDRFVLPGEPTPFEVTSIEDYNYGFHQWQPGSVVKLKRVTG